MDLTSGAVNDSGKEVSSDAYGAEDRAERARLVARIDALSPEALELASWMSQNPEVSMQEVATSARYQRYLEGRGFAITKRVDDMETAFLAETGSEQAPLSVALLAEMDALPEIGHACGHNLSGPASLLAAAALAEELPASALRIVVVGCPAEETGLGKPALVRGGAFDGVDVAMMAHASDMRRAHRLFLGNQKFEFVYHGRAAHAAAYPERGVNALDAVVSFYVAVGLLRQQLPRDVRIHVVISDGGTVPNIIPERAAAKVWVRALDPAHLEASIAKVQACARAAAESTATRLEVEAIVGGSPPMKANLTLAALYRRQLEELDYPESVHGPADSIGSSDITHVSRVVPTIHPNFPIGSDLQLHTREFAAATQTQAGETGLVEAARALALTVRDLARNGKLRERVRADWDRDDA
jgi:amidohydrolase